MEIESIRGTLSTRAVPQRERLAAFLRERGIARLADIRRAGVTAATVGRLERAGAVHRLGRGLYQLASADTETHHTLAEAARRVPKGVICLVSALVFHGVTDELPRKVWVAIGHKAWKPRAGYPPLRVVRFAEPFLLDGVEHHLIEGVSVPIYGLAKTLADAFRHRRSVGTDVAVRAIKEALKRGRATPAEIAAAAARGGAWSAMRPYLEALTADA